jgi:hypothetical protein
MARYSFTIAPNFITAVVAAGLFTNSVELVASKAFCAAIWKIFSSVLTSLHARRAANVASAAGSDPL